MSPEEAGYPRRDGNYIGGMMRRIKGKNGITLQHACYSNRSIAALGSTHASMITTYKRADLGSLNGDIGSLVYFVGLVDVRGG